ncbi:FAS1-like dehydratase domain-containing protein [Rhodococcus opacus]|uniref:FAS1-like dehydratase domain-containing protein n=1 Tax=Rhodococcus opacus TaxID=37919 RepID=UPI0024736948|nr:MaoC family dehydratase N-terminal domain-containing protein [Rhodococcus opacus]MDH6293308.1 acyl dehydratase [Rhodococcus opacus]
MNPTMTAPDYGRITPAGIAGLQSRVGEQVPITQPYLRQVSQDAILHMARALGDANPLYFDREYAASTHYGTMVAPHALLYGVAWGSWDLRAGNQLPGVTALHSGDSWTYLRPVLEGDTLSATKTMARCDPARSRQGAQRIFQTDRIEIRNQRGEVVAVQNMSTIRVEKATGGNQKTSADDGKTEASEAPNYSEEAIATLDREVLAENPRGSAPRYWEDVMVGDQMDPVVKGPFMLADLMSWVQAVGSPHVRSGRHWITCRQDTPSLSYIDKQGVPQQHERIHWSDDAAASFGAPAAFDYGAQRAGYASYAATRWAGDDGWLAALDVQYRGMVYNGDILRITGSVSAKWRGEVTGNGYVDIRISGRTNRGSEVMPGSITCALPSKDTGGVVFPADVSVDRPDDKSETA